jgi:hypothetical protein
MSLVGRPLALPWCALGASLLSIPASLAAEWDSGAALSVGTVYSDNICLSEDDKVGKWVATATPSGYLRREGGKSDLDLKFSLAFNTLANSSLRCSQGGQSFGGVNNVSPAPRLRLNSQTELLRNWFYFDAQAAAGQNLINAFAPGGGDEINGSGNINTTYRYSLSPYLAHEINQRYNVYLRYTFDERRNTENFVRDSTGDRLSFDVGSSPERNRFSYGLSADYYEVTYEASRNLPEVTTELSNVRIRSAYRLSRKWQLYGSAGQDSNNFLSAFDNIDGSTWDAGVRWTPGPRIEVEAGTGERFFGSTPRVSINYRHRRSRLMFEYQRELTYTRNLRNDDVLPGFPPPEGEIDIPGFEGTPTTLSAQPIVNEGYALRYFLRGAHNTFSVGATYSEQTRAVEQRKSKFTRYAASWRHRFSSQFSVTSRLTYAEREGDGFLLDEDNPLGVVRSSDTWDLVLGADKKLGRNTTALFSYRFRDRQSDQFGDSYQENRFTLTFRYDF